MKTLRYIIIFSLLLIRVANAQESNKEEVYTLVEQQPEYPGGISAMMKFISSNVSYPNVCRENSIAGKVFIKFIVDIEGNVTNAEVIKSSGCTLLDKEALRVIQAMPLWTPGMQSGRKVRTYYNIPINFKLDSETPSIQLKQSGVSSIYKDATSLLLEGNANAAMEKYASAQSDYNCWFVLAVMQYNQGKKSQAKDNFTRTLNSITDTQDPYYNLSKTYLTKYFGQQ